MRVLLVVNMFLLAAIFVSLGREVILNHRVADEIARLQTDAEVLSQRNTDLEAWKNAFQTETALESEARLKLGLKKSGETLVIVQNAEVSAANEATNSPTPLVLGEASDTEENRESLANAQKWWYYFFAAPSL